jgi:hypothetical protein
MDGWARWLATASCMMMMLTSCCGIGEIRHNRCPNAHVRADSDSSQWFVSGQLIFWAIGMTKLNAFQEATTACPAVDTFQETGPGRGSVSGMKGVLVSLDGYSTTT